jgi:anti-anti-sigma factor
VLASSGNPVPRSKRRLTLHKKDEWYSPCSSVGRTMLCSQRWEEVMLNVTIAKVGELAVVGCEGRIVQRESAYKLRETVTSQTDARIIVLELSEVRVIGGGGLGMLAFLQRWAREHNIRFLLFHPSKEVERQLKHAKPIAEFYVASLEEMRALLAYANSRYAQAA